MLRFSPIESGFVQSHIYTETARIERINEGRDSTDRLIVVAELKCTRLQAVGSGQGDRDVRERYSFGTNTKLWRTQALPVTAEIKSGDRFFLSDKEYRVKYTEEQTPGRVVQIEIVVEEDNV